MLQIEQIFYQYTTIYHNISALKSDDIDKQKFTLTSL